MDKEFVTYDQALALKELGFDEHCLCHWYKVDNLTIRIYYWQNDDNYFDINGNDLEVTAPFKSQVFRWFREKYEFCYHIFSLQITASDKTGYRYSWEIYNHTPEWIAEDSSLLGSLTYEEAENACIDKLIELVKNK